MSKWNQISHAQGAKLFRRLAVGYRAGLDLRSLWQRECQSPLPILADRAKRVYQSISSGDTLAEAMNDARGYFSPLTIAVIRAGEQSGKLENAFAQLAKNHEEWQRFRRQVVSQMAWPLFELGFSILVIGALILLMGWAVETSKRDPIDWLGWGWSTRGYFWGYVTLVSGLVGALAATYAGNQLGWFGPWPARVLLAIPLIGGILRDMALARLNWALGAALGAGMEVSESMKLALHAAQYMPLDSVEPRMLEQLKQGATVYETMEDTERFPEEMLAMVANGEVVGELPETLERLANDYQDRVQRGMKTLSTVCFVLTFLFVGAIIIAAIIFLFNKLIIETYQSLM